VIVCLMINTPLPMAICVLMLCVGYCSAAYLIGSDLSGACSLVPIPPSGLAQLSPTTSQAIPLGGLPPAMALTSAAAAAWEAPRSSIPPPPSTTTTWTHSAMHPAVAAVCPPQQPIQASGFSLSPATQPFPQKLVDKVRSGQFIEMRELLADNISLMQQLEGFGTQFTAPALPRALKPRLREATSLPSWMYCFLAYLGIQTTDPLTRNGLAYARLIIREAQRHGGNGWLDYDRLFRQQAALDPALRWDTLHPDMQAATLAGRPVGNSPFCTLCREPDHTADHCALSYLRQPSSNPPPGRSGAVDYGRRSRTESQHRVYISWNRGRCNYSGSCRYRHVCASCQQLHMAKSCPHTSAESEYRHPTTATT
jgi:hypothetical protein